MSGRFENRLLSELKDKEYRDAFVEGHIRTGIAYQIRALRNARGLSQEEMGKLADMPQSVIARLENPDYGKYSLSTLLNLASAYDVALLVRFTSFSDLLQRTQNLSPAGLNAPSYDDDRGAHATSAWTLMGTDSTTYSRGIRSTTNPDCLKRPEEIRDLGHGGRINFGLATKPNEAVRILP